MSKKKYLTWAECNFKWNDNPYTWEEVFVIAKIGTVISSKPEINPNWQKISQVLTEKEKVVFINLVCKVNEMNYEETKVNKKIYITANRIKKTINEVSVYLK